MPHRSHPLISPLLAAGLLGASLGARPHESHVGFAQALMRQHPFDHAVKLIDQPPLRRHLQFERLLAHALRHQFGVGDLLLQGRQLARPARLLVLTFALGAARQPVLGQAHGFG